MVKALQKLETEDLLKLYGDISFRIDLTSDQILWQGPISILIEEASSQMNGPSYMEYLDNQGFWHRLTAIANTSRDNSSYRVEYTLHPNGRSPILMEENGTVIYDFQGIPQAIHGIIRPCAEQPLKLSTKETSGYDPISHLPGPDMLHEILSSYLEQTVFSKGMSWAFLVIEFDQIMALACGHGIKPVKELVFNTAQHIRHITRFDDFLGHTNPVSFGLVVKECDQWGVVQTTERLLSLVNEVRVQGQQGETLTPKVSIGGVVFPSDFKDAASIIKSATQNAQTSHLTKIEAPFIERPYPLSDSPIPFKRRRVDKKS